MWKIDKDTQMITMTKGDTPSFRIECNQLDEEGNVYPYEPQEDDLFILAVKQGKEDSNCLFAIEIPPDTMTAVFKEEYTKNLEIGKYIYEVSLNRPNDEYCCTFICNKILKLDVEVY